MAVIDWDLGNNSIIDMMTSIMRPRASFRAADEPPTTLENLLQAYVEEEQLTGSNQWRLVDFVVGCVRGAPS